MSMQKSSISCLVTVFLLLQVIAPIHIFAAPYDTTLAEKNAYTGKSIYAAQVINDFNTEDQAALWEAGHNTKEVKQVTSLLNGSGSPYEGSGALEVVPDLVKCYEWRTISRSFDTPLDLSDANFLTLAANVWGWKQNDFFLKIRLTSGADTYEAISGIDGDKWKVIYFDIHKWDNRSSIDQIEISYMKNYDLEGLAPGMPGYDFWDGRLQIDYLSATQIADLDFHIPGITEGFSALGGTAVVPEIAGNSALQYTITDPADTYLESGRLSLDAATRNIVQLRMKNNTGAEKLRISWTTDQDTHWDQAKSMLFDLENATQFNDYEFSMNSAFWKDQIDQIRLAPVTDSAAGTMLEVDKISFSWQQVEEQLYHGKVDHVLIDADTMTITATGSVNSEFRTNHPDAELALYRLPVYVDEKTADYSQLTALAAGAVTESFALSFALAQDDMSSIYSKFVVVLKSSEGEFSLADTAKYVTNPEVLAANKEPYTPTKSIKGLQVQLPADAERLGVQHAAINIAFDQMLTLSGHQDASIPYTYNGKTYYFKKNYIASLDNEISSMTNNGMAVTVILIMYRSGLDNPDSPNKDIIHPDSTPEGTVFAPNLTNEIGVNYYQAITSFLAERYSRADQAYGRVMGYIVGNEVGQNKVWNNMGPKLVDEYVKQYEYTLRTTYNIVKSKMQNARVYISLDHFWNMANSFDSKWLYDNKMIVDKLSKVAKAGGDYEWNVAFHPYPEDLFNPKTWNDKTATDSFDTYRITFKNLQVLTNYLQQEGLKYNGEQRRVILSEQGFHSGGNSPAEQEVQAAAYAYAYYKVKSLPGIDAFIIHRHVDHTGEGGLNLGIWTTMPGSIYEAGQQKRIYNVFKNIDTTDSLSVTEFAKGVIGIHDWQQAIPEFNPAQLETRPVQIEAPMGVPVSTEGEHIISSFDTEMNGWSATDNVSGITLDQADKVAGASSLKAIVAGSYKQDYKGVTKVFDTPRDFSATPIIKASIKAEVLAAGITAEDKAKFMIRAYSGDQVIEGSAVGRLDRWNTLAIDLRGWGGLASVERIKIWAQPEKTLNWTSGAIKIDEVAALPVTSIVNLLVALEHPPKPKVGDTLSILIRNLGTGVFEDDVELTGTNGIMLDKSHVPVTIQPGEEVTVSTVITSLDSSNFEGGNVELIVGGERYVYLLIEKGYPDYTLDNKELVFGDFEGGHTDGWQVGSNTASIAAVKSDSSHHAYPSSAKHGAYMLEVLKSPKLATTESTVEKTFRTPVDISGFEKVRFDIYGWGGTSSAYLAKISLIAEDNSRMDYEQEIAANEWQSIAIDISSFAGKDKVKKIEVSYRGKDTVYHNGPWGGYFYIDNVRTTGIVEPEPIHLVGMVPKKFGETIALQGGKLQLVLEGTFSDGSSRVLSAAAEGTTYSGFAEDIVSVTADGLVTAVGPGTTAIFIHNRTITLEISVTVAADLPRSLISFETGLEGWGKSDPADGSIAEVKSILSSGGFPRIPHIPAAWQGGGLLQVDMGAVPPAVPKLIGVPFEPAADLSEIATISYAFYSWGGIPAAKNSGEAAVYKTIFRLTSSEGETYEQVEVIQPDEWNLIQVDLTKVPFSGSIAKLEIGHVVERSDLLEWKGKFFIDHITATEKDTSPPVDTIAPTIKSTLPSNNAQNVERNTTITIQFSEAIKAADKFERSYHHKWRADDSCSGKDSE